MFAHLSVMSILLNGMRSERVNSIPNAAMRQSFVAPFTQTGREAQVPRVTAASRRPSDYILT